MTIENETETRAKLALEIEAGLAHFTGGDETYQHWLPLTYTEGVKYLAEKAGAYWLLEIVASYQPDPQVRDNQRLQEFQLWELRVSPDGSGVVTCHEDSDEPAILTQAIPSTDFPLPYLKLYVEGGMLLLPCEH